eukprot:CAMPEP_0197537738 /NCGR_PEP_ID=MMETSP1318-20131121/57778_1 /TAXON_ID=552666 /ORGANISM="Partenskyella glossopodia, Strain RCC365" /LENGTH=53 /DNA_ID=CAMNT_0043095973 /DNA_START=368 /DNA_END=529 /DNA_ORIENTATION=+
MGEVISELVHMHREQQRFAYVHFIASMVPVNDTLHASFDEFDVAIAHFYALFD